MRISIPLLGGPFDGAAVVIAVPAGIKHSFVVADVNRHFYSGRLAFCSRLKYAGHETPPAGVLVEVLAATFEGVPK